MTEHPTVLGDRYELDSVIGRGGMAEVWRAHDIRLGRPVAVKRLRVDLATDETFQTRFRREAQAAAGMNHPNIVSVYDTGEAVVPATGLSVPYIVMELVEGHTLKEVLRDDRRVLPERALEFTQGVLDALQYSHRMGIIHRDIKPANVMLTSTGTVKVMDFGIARAVADTSATMTQTAAVIGTAQYLSPEQARGEKVDSRSDIYSAGILMYELLCGRPPFVGDSPVSVAYQHVRQAPTPPSQVDPELTPAMDAVTMKALAKNPADRYQSAQEMRDDISRIQGGMPVVAPIPSEPEPEHQVDPATAVAATALAAGATSEALAEEDDDVDESHRRSPWMIAIIVLLIALLSSVAWGLWTLFQAPAEVTESVAVPDVVNLTQEDAERKLEDSGLVATVTETKGDENTIGKVVTQEPTKGTRVPTESSVTITVNQGPGSLQVPDLVGMNEDEARAELKEAGFTGDVDTTDAANDSEPTSATAGEIIATSPRAGAEVDASSDILLTLATGKSRVPNFALLTVSRAQALASEQGFTLNVVNEETLEVPPGQIFQQKPQAGSLAARSKPITVYVAEEPPQVTQPPATTAPPTTATPSETPTPDATTTASEATKPGG